MKVFLQEWKKSGGGIIFSLSGNEDLLDEFKIEMKTRNEDVRDVPTGGYEVYIMKDCKLSEIVTVRDVVFLHDDELDVFFANAVQENEAAPE
jgi:hypothetical protein